MRRAVDASHAVVSVEDVHLVRRLALDAELPARVEVAQADGVLERDVGGIHVRGASRVRSRVMTYCAMRYIMTCWVNVFPTEESAHPL